MLGTSPVSDCKAVPFLKQTTTLQHINASNPSSSEMDKTSIENNPAPHQTQSNQILGVIFLYSSSPDISCSVLKKDLEEGTSDEDLHD